MGCITNIAWRELPHDAAFQPRQIYLLRRTRTLAPNSSNREYEFGASREGPEFPFDAPGVIVCRQRFKF